MDPVQSAFWMCQWDPVLWKVLAGTNFSVLNCMRHQINALAIAHSQRGDDVLRHSFLISEKACQLIPVTGALEYFT